MNWKLMKKIRVIISLVFFLSIIILYLDLSFSLQQEYSVYPLFLQFIPSFLKFISIGTIAGIGFIIVMLLTFLFGRAYCSSICPLGTFQDIATYLRMKKKRIKFLYREEHKKTRYGFLAAAVILFIFGISFGLNILDPYSNFGRIISNLLRPATIGINNSIAFALESINIYSIYPLEFKGINIAGFIFSFLFLGLILWMSIKHGRLYCNSVCPVGTLLGFISKYSLFTIKISYINCSGCGACGKVCKSSCIDTEDEIIDYSRCVLCFNCFTVCPSSGLEYKFRYSRDMKTVIEPVNINKRNFLIQSAVWFTGGSLALKAQEKILVYKENKIPETREYAVSPPGSLSIENFTDHCTACHLCVAACPTQVLQPSFLEYGLLGILQPRMDYIKSFCNYDCTACTDVCPSGAILPQNGETKKLIQLGKASFIKDNCIVYSQGTDCGACAEHCPTKAVRMVPDPQVNKNAPLIDEEICVGCGACEFACPTIPYKAIYVKSNPVHLAAKLPKQEALEQPDPEEEFPF